MTNRAFRRIVGFGEAMLRLTVPVGESLENAHRFMNYVGGAELNGLIAASRSGMRCTWVSALPEVPMSQIIIRHVSSHRVEPAVQFTERGRVGVYYLELAAAPRPARIFYDRAESAFALLDAESIDWTELLDADTCLYLTGVTAAVGSGPRQAAEQAIQVATSVDATVALDINYRASLWPQDEAVTWLRSQLPHVDVLSASRHDLEQIGIDGPKPYQTVAAEYDLEAAIGMTKDLTNHGQVSIELVVANSDVEHRYEESATVIDPVGVGDAMFGTFLGGFVKEGLAEAGRQGLRAAVTCFGLHGDALETDPGNGPIGGGIIR
jgi:2-dehydro-3-deoxygluconokinase